MIYPDTSKGGRGKTVQKPDSFSKQRLSDARFVLRHAPDLAEAVLKRTMSLDAALEKTIQAVYPAPPLSKMVEFASG